MANSNSRDVIASETHSQGKAAFGEEQNVDVLGYDTDEALKAALKIQRYYRGYRTRRELRGWSLSSSTRWIEALKEAQWQQTVQSQQSVPPNDDDDDDNDDDTTASSTTSNDRDDIIQHDDTVKQQKPDTILSSTSRSRSSQTGLSPEVRRKWKIAGQVALRAGGDDNISDKIVEQHLPGSEGGIDSTSIGRGGGGDALTLHTFQHSVSTQKHRRPSIPTTTAADVEKTAKMMDLQYFLEMVDTKHRYGSNLRAYHSVWKNGPSKQNFFYWLDYGDGKDFELERVPRERLDREQVRYLNREERQKYLVVVDDNGRFRWAKNGQRVWTDSEQFRDSIHGVVPVDDKGTPRFSGYTSDGDDENNSSSSSTSSEDDDYSDESSDEEVQRYVNPDFDKAKGIKKLEYVSPAVIFNHLMRKSLKKKNKWIFLVSEIRQDFRVVQPPNQGKHNTDTSFRIYIGIKDSGAFQHSSFLRGARIASAGLLKVKNGQLRSLSPLSGHYRPPAANFRAFVHALQNNGVDMSHLSISRSYAVLLGIEGYMKYKKRKIDVKEKIEEGKSKVTTVLSNDEKENYDEHNGHMGDEISKVSSSQPTQKKVGMATTTTQVSSIPEGIEQSPSSSNHESGKQTGGVLSQIVKTFSRKSSITSDERKPVVKILGRGIPGTGPEEGVPAPEGCR